MDMRLQVCCGRTWLAFTEPRCQPHPTPFGMNLEVLCLVSGPNHPNTSQKGGGC